MPDMMEFIAGLPKVELHLHIEGTLEPEMMFALAQRNGVRLPFATMEEVRDAYHFTDLQSFLDIYYRATAVLQTERDFHDLMLAYLHRVAAENVRHAEIFFDPQSHTARGVPLEVFMAGFASARAEAAATLGVSSLLIMCFLRHLSGADAIATFEAAAPFFGDIAAVGLDSGEVGNPPERFEEVFARARAAGLRAVAHAGEEGPPGYIRGALDVLGAERIDHGVAAERDDALVERLAREQIPLTMCPLSNLALRGVDDLEEHNLKRLMDRGVRVTVNSDDPAYFGGYIGANYAAIQEALGLDRDDLVILAGNSIAASFLDQESKARLRTELDAYAAQR